MNSLQSISGLSSGAQSTTSQPIRMVILASLVDQVIKNLPAMRKTGFDPWIEKVPWRRAWQPTPVCLPGEPPRTQ